MQLLLTMTAELGVWLTATREAFKGTIALASGFLMIDNVGFPIPIRPVRPGGPVGSGLCGGCPGLVNDAGCRLCGRTRLWCSVSIAMTMNS